MATTLFLFMQQLFSGANSLAKSGGREGDELKYE